MRLALFSAATRGAGDYVFLFFGAFVMAVPIAFFMGTAFYFIFGTDRGDPAERELPFWRTKLWRRFVQVIAAVVFTALMAAALISSLVRA